VIAKEIVADVCTNFYASNLELGAIPPVFVHQVGRNRWIIDTEVFQTITTDGHHKKPSVHQGRGQALIVLTMIRVLAFTLTLVFFHRQIRSHFRSCSFSFCDLGQRLAYQFVITAQQIPVEAPRQLKLSPPLLWATGIPFSFPLP
jgi:hypothetical protein